MAERRRVKAKERGMKKKYIVKGSEGGREEKTAKKGKKRNLQGEKSKDMEEEKEKGEGRERKEGRQDVCCLRGRGYENRSDRLLRLEKVDKSAMTQ